MECTRYKIWSILLVYEQLDIDLAFDASMS